MFSTQSDNCTPFVHTFDIIVLFAAELKELKIAISGKGLITFSRNIAPLCIFQYLSQYGSLLVNILLQGGISLQGLCGEGGLEDSSPLVDETEEYFCYWNCGKHGKRRKCWLRAFSPLSTIFKKPVFLKILRLFLSLKW